MNGTTDYRAVAGVLIFGFPLLGVWYLVVQKTIASQYDIDICSCFAFSFLISYARPCKSTVANMSLSFYSFLFGVCALAHYLWMLNVSTPTESLKLVFLFIILTAQLPVILWAGYYLAHYLLKKTILSSEFKLHIPARNTHHVYLVFYLYCKSIWMVGTCCIYFSDKLH